MVVGRGRADKNKYLIYEYGVKTKTRVEDSRGSLVDVDREKLLIILKVLIENDCEELQVLRR